MKNLEESIFYAKSHLANLMLRMAQDRKEQIESEEDRKKQSETEKELKKSARDAVSSGESNLTFKKSKPVKIHSEKNPERRKVAGTIRPPQPRKRKEELLEEAQRASFKNQNDRDNLIRERERKQRGAAAHVTPSSPVEPLRVKPLKVKPLSVPPLKVKPLSVKPLSVRPLSQRLLSNKSGRITKGNTTFTTLSPEDIADIDDITDNIKPIAGTKAKGEFTPARKLRKKLAALQLQALETPFTRARAQQTGDKALTDRQDAHTKRITEGLNKGTEKTTPEPFPVVKVPTIPRSSLIRSQRQPKSARRRIAKMRNHHTIKWNKTRVMYKVASLQNDSVFIQPATQSKFAKYWLLNARQVNGNGWGVTQQSIAKNIRSFIGRPFVITAKQWIAKSAYGDVFDHPFVPTNDMNKILAHQERYRVGNIIDIENKNGDYSAVIEINPKFAHLNLPPFCSPAIYQLDASEHEQNISKWTGLHLAGLTEDPAYGARIALLRGTCTGGSECVHSLKTAKQRHGQSDIIKKQQRRETLRDFTENANEMALSEEVPIPKSRKTPSKATLNEFGTQFNRFIDKGVPFRPTKPKSKMNTIISARLQLLAVRNQIVNPNEVGGRFNPKTPLKKEIPFGEDKRTKRRMGTDVMSRVTQSFDELATGEKIRPKKPSQADRRRIIQAKSKKKRKSY